MGKKRGYNWKARQIVETEIDDRPTKKIKLDFNPHGNYDQSNTLVLPSEKRKTKVKNKSEKVTRILSNKQRKKLEKIVERKEKKLARVQLLEDLSKVQATPEELKQLTSIITVQTKGLKKANLDFKSVKTEIINEKTTKINSIKGSKRQPFKREILYDKNDPNIVGFEQSSSSDSEDEEDEENDQEVDVKSQEAKTCENDIAKKEENIANTAVHSDKQSPETIKKEIQISKENIRKPAVFVEVKRSKEIQEERLKLPILAEEQQIMETINENDVVVIAGETGSGKTTQVPQFLYEAGYATEKMIGITEPRRIAAMSMSKRVAHEMNLTTDEVSYLIRFEGNVTEDTKVKFMTDGVLLRELKDDRILTKYSVIILDEAHERSVHTDVLIGMLSRIVLLRKKKDNPLKLIIMSATLRLEDFTDNKKLFKVTPPVINVEARQYPVSIHFNQKTNENYLKEALKKTTKIHTTLPDGGILVFVTGQQEVNYLVRKLRTTFPLKQKKKVLKAMNRLKDKPKITDFNQKVKNSKRKFKIVPEINLDDYDINNEEINSDNEEIISDEDDKDIIMPVHGKPLWVLPLFSLLPSEKQARVFEPPPAGCRLCIISTNVAETSLTIPNIKYVVDTGKTKEKFYDKVTGVTSHVVTWVSKASAKQRSGRAGRTGPGHCYRLYSSAVYNDVFQEYSIPEIRKKPVDDLYLQMKCMNLSIPILNFPFPTSPGLEQLQTAENRLQTLELLDDKKEPTPLGRVVSQYPVMPRYGKMLALSNQFDLLPYTILMVAALSVQEVLEEVQLGNVDANASEKLRLKRKKWSGTGNSLLLGDVMMLLRAVAGAEFENCKGELTIFCKKNGLREKAVLEIRKLRIQLTNEIKNVLNIDVIVDPKLSPPTDDQMKYLRQILLCGMGDQIAKKIDVREISDKEEKRRLKHAYMIHNIEEPVFLHRNSVLFSELPEYCIYQEAYTVHETNKTYIRGITAIETKWLPDAVPRLCNLSKPLLEPEPWYCESLGKVRCMVSGMFGQRSWPLPDTSIDYPENLEAYKLFTKFFLEGKVFKKLEKYKLHLLSRPNSITKSWGAPLPRIKRILEAMTSNRCRSKMNVEDMWETDTKFLLAEYLLFLPESVHVEIKLLWPPR